MSYELDALKEQKRIMYFTSLLNETLPSAMITPDLMVEMALKTNDQIGLIHILFSNQLQATIEDKEASYVADWKALIHEHMLQALKAPFIHTSCVLNLAPYTRTIVYSFDPHYLDHLKPHITKWFHQISHYMDQETNGQIMAFANPQLILFKDIGQLYKDLRRLLNYQYTIGMATITFYDDFHFIEQYSVAEYKYIQRYEQLLNTKAYNDLLLLIEELNAYILTYMIKDSKVIYIFKELMSISIRHLFNHETENLHLIDLLNFAINNFSTQFNDLKDVTLYIENLILTLKEALADTRHYHPYVKKILNAIESDYKQDLTLEAIADQLNLSNAHLSRLFKEEIGITYKQYLTKFRLDRIKLLLDTTDKTIQEIASLTGYQSANQLTRIFKKYEQVTPRDYRMTQGR